MSETPDEAPTGLPDDAPESDPLGVPAADPDREVPDERTEDALPGIVGPGGDPPDAG